MDKASANPNNQLPLFYPKTLPIKLFVGVREVKVVAIDSNLDWVTARRVIKVTTDESILNLK